MQIGDLAPDFTLDDQSGTPRHLTAMLQDGPVVLFFYPAAMTKGCTKESCRFRDLASEFAAVGAQRVGISMDQIAKQRQFSDANSLDYPLLSDVNGSVAKTYGVKRAVDFLKVKRATFVIDTNRRILDIITHELDMDVHADRALRALTKR